MISLVKFCFEVNAQNQCEYLLSRFLEPPSDATSVYDILSSFLPLLTQYLAERNQNLSAEPYRSFVTAVIQTFAEKIMVGWLCGLRFSAAKARKSWAKARKTLVVQRWTDLCPGRAGDYAESWSDYPTRASETSSRNRIFSRRRKRIT
jgi:hypothetical protein